MRNTKSLKEIINRVNARKDARIFLAGGLSHAERNDKLSAQNSLVIAGNLISKWELETLYADLNKLAKAISNI